MGLRSRNRAANKVTATIASADRATPTISWARLAACSTITPERSDATANPATASRRTWRIRRHRARGRLSVGFQNRAKYGSSSVRSLLAGGAVPEDHSHTGGHEIAESNQCTRDVSLWEAAGIRRGKRENESTASAFTHHIMAREPTTMAIKPSSPASGPNVPPVHSSGPP